MELAETGSEGKGWAPYYVFIRADKNSTDVDAAGYMSEQLVLKLMGLGYGTCWQVGSGPRIPKVKDKRNLAKIAVGKPDQELYRKSINEFKRVSIDEISGGSCNEAIAEAVRLAPSSMNLQPWYIHGDGDNIHVYRRKCAGPLYMEKVTSLDIGIALYHIDVAAEKKVNIDSKSGNLCQLDKIDICIQNIESSMSTAYQEISSPKEIVSIMEKTRAFMSS